VIGARVVLQAKPKTREGRDFELSMRKPSHSEKPDYIDRILTIIRRSASLGDTPVTSE